MRAPRGSFRRTVTVAVTVLAVLASLLTVLSAPASAEDRPTLRSGSSGDAVLVLERRLVELGFDPGAVDTSFDSSTRSAVVSFQGAAGIGRDGIVGPITWGKLDQGIRAPGPGTAPDPGPVARPTLRLGSSGDAVLVLERRLVELGFDPGAVDTSFDSSTRSAVVSFQGAAGIGRDGIVGPITWGKLDQGVTAPAPSPTPAPAPSPDPDPQPAPAPEPEVLKLGSTGPEVRALEQRLHSLGYWVDDIDDRFESGTHHAVVALQKTAGLGRDGVVGPLTQAALDAGTRPQAEVTSGHLLEVDLSLQIVMVVDDGHVSWIYDTSTGKVAGTTPIGSHSITREIDGYRYAPLGTLYRPKYFYRGVAFHGYPSVPAGPASHGCVRLTYPAMDHLWATGAAPVGTTVRVHR